MRKIMLVVVFIFFSCTSRQVVKEHVYVEENKVPGTITEPWVEPMIDTVKVPPQLDPKGIVYRPEHNTIVEIRPGRVQPVQYPEPQNEPESDQWKR